jgi:hypothetical protein
MTKKTNSKQKSANKNCMVSNIDPPEADVIYPSIWLRVVSPSTLLRTVSLSNGLSNHLEFCAKITVHKMINILNFRHFRHYTRQFRH